MTIRASQKGLTRELTYEAYLEEKPSTVDVQWGSNPNTILDQDDPFKDVFEGLSFAVSFAQALLDLVKEVADSIVVLVARPIVSGFEALILAVREATLTFIELISGLSINGLVHFPETPKSRRRPNEVLYDIGMAYLDEKDGNRPVMVGDVFGAALIMCWSMPNLESLLKVKEDISNSFKGIGSEVLDIDDYVKNKFQKVDESWRSPTTFKGSSGMAPDFGFSGSLLDFKDFKKVVDGASTFINYLDTSRDITKKLDTIFDLVEQKLNRIQQIADDLVVGFNSALSLFLFEDAAGMLLVSGTGEAEDFAKAIINAPNHPKYPKTSFFDDVATSYRRQGLESPLDRQLGEEGLFGGGVLLHIQGPNTKENTDRINALVKLIFKQFSPSFQENLFESEGKRIGESTETRFKALSKIREDL